MPTLWEHKTGNSACTHISLWKHNTGNSEHMHASHQETKGRQIFYMPCKWHDQDKVSCKETITIPAVLSTYFQENNSTAFTDFFFSEILFNDYQGISVFQRLNASPIHTSVWVAYTGQHIVTQTVVFTKIYQRWRVDPNMHYRILMISPKHQMIFPSHSLLMHVAHTCWHYCGVYPPLIQLL